MLVDVDDVVVIFGRGIFHFFIPLSQESPKPAVYIIIKEMMKKRKKRKSHVHRDHANEALREDTTLEKNKRKQLLNGAEGRTRAPPQEEAQALILSLFVLFCLSPAVLLRAADEGNSPIILRRKRKRKGFSLIGSRKDSTMAVFNQILESGY